jgi:hypothetical protein
LVVGGGGSRQDLSCVFLLELFPALPFPFPSNSTSDLPVIAMPRHGKIFAPPRIRGNIFLAVHSL